MIRDVSQSNGTKRSEMKYVFIIASPPLRGTNTRGSRPVRAETAKSEVNRDIHAKTSSTLISNCAAQKQGNQLAIMRHVVLSVSVSFKRMRLTLRRTASFQTQVRHLQSLDRFGGGLTPASFSFERK
jgi:hypothetical protein